MFKLTPRKLKFTAVAATATAIDFGILLLITTLTGTSTIKANFISSSISFIYSFFANKKYVFKTPDHHIQREAVKYILLTLFGIWVIQPVVIHLLEPSLQELELHGIIVVIIAKLIASIATFIWNYLCSTRLVFKKKH